MKSRSPVKNHMKCDLKPSSVARHTGICLYISIISVYCPRAFRGFEIPDLLKNIDLVRLLLYITTSVMSADANLQGIRGKTSMIPIFEVPR